ncbi:ABC transporter permease [Streptomyces netropsis]|uniref:ABC-2 family transporter protein n=1 Tax=Streptomyces netropsis TaxID=55404 RepID=A0A7W7PGF5_STRNE|nr:ABC transporter permease [Streptomyces netropsis]MBB4889024.1 hypothetical protein [Streptomyces netropsis]GGR10938.1 hypothetical protein GCM10010219_14620 [Streptomyces netropsis]
MRLHLRWFTTATRYALVEHGHNRLAMVLIALYVPAWVTLAHLSVSPAPVRFRLWETGQLLVHRGNDLTQISGALNAVCLITGFMMFAATFASGTFDRRLAMAGYSRTYLALAKLASLAIAAAGVASYATAAIRATTTLQQPLLVAAALFCAAMTYGALGVTLASLLDREVEGMFAIAMISVVDIVLQNPVISSNSGNSIVLYLPAFGAVQAASAGAFSTTAPLHCLGVQFLWFTAAALMALFAFHRRTRNALPPTAVADVPTS